VLALLVAADHSDLFKYGRIDLELLKQIANDTNKEWADRLGIGPSTAITCVKPVALLANLLILPLAFIRDGALIISVPSATTLRTQLALSCTGWRPVRTRPT
jgi:hypothetical protein